VNFFLVWVGFLPPSFQSTPFSVNSLPNLRPKSTSLVSRDIAEIASRAGCDSANTM
jgi:hypothetical protein